MKSDKRERKGRMERVKYGGGGWKGRRRGGWIEKRSRDHAAAARLRARERERVSESSRKATVRRKKRDGMNHDSNKTPSLGMISTATRSTATVSPLNPLTNGSAVSQSANSGFAAALRKLAKQAEDPRGSALSGASSPVSSPTTSHNSPVTTPKRASLGPLLGQSRGHSVPSTPPVVTIAPTKTSNSLWRAEARQAEVSVREHLDNHQHPQDKRTPPISSPRPFTHHFGVPPSSVMQDPRLQSLSLPGQMHPVIPPGAVPEEYLRALRPFATSDDLRLTSLPLSLDPAAAHAAAAAAYYHPAYLHHPLSLQRMEESLCLSALRSSFYSVPGGGAFPSLHPTALHLHLPGSRYPAELNHTVLAERLQMESELRQREREKERERETKGLEREREEELDRQKDRQRDRQQQMVRAAESHYLAELQARRAPPEDRARPGERLTPNRPDKAKESEHLGFTAPKPLLLQSSLHSSRGSVPHPVPSLVPSHMGKHHGALAATMMTQRTNEEMWLTRQRGQDRERPLELDLRSPGKGTETWRENQRPNSVHLSSHSKDVLPSLGAPPPLISPKGPLNPPVPPTTLWNPASFVESPPTRKLTPSAPPSRPPPGLTRTERAPLSWGERTEDSSRRRVEGLERYPSMKGASLHEAGSWSKAEQDRTIQNLYQRQHMNNLQQRSCAPLSVPTSSSDLGVQGYISSPSPGRERQNHVPDSLLVYDEVLKQHRRLLSKLDLEEKKRREAREGGYYYDMDESYDESDEEEVKAHLKRVTEQPPLKLDTSSEKVEFLSICGLTTLSNRDEILAEKKKKRRKMLRERSPSPPAIRVKKKACTALTTPYTAEQMDTTPELEEKKDFLSMFNLTHMSPAERREKQKTEELLKAIKKKTVTLDTLRYNPLPPCSTPPASVNGDSKSISLPNGHPYPDSPSPSPPFLHKPNNLLYNDALKSSADSQVARIPTLLTPQHEKTEFMETHPNRKHHSLQNGIAASPMKKGPLNCGQNGRSRPWEKITPNVFAQHFHQAVLQSTHTKDGLLSTDLLPHRASPLKGSHPTRGSLHTAINGHHFPQHSSSRDTLSAHEPQSDDGGESGHDEDDEDEEVESAPRKWQGIESVFEAYQQHVEEYSIERQVLQSQCKKLEAQNHNLTRMAEQLSLTMGELVSQRQKAREEKERLQAQLEHFRRCLTLPNIQWGRGQVNGHTPR